MLKPGTKILIHKLNEEDASQSSWDVFLESQEVTVQRCVDDLIIVKREDMNIEFCLYQEGLEYEPLDFPWDKDHE